MSLQVKHNLASARAFFRAFGKSVPKKMAIVLQKTARQGRTIARRQIHRDFNPASFVTEQWLKFGVMSTGRVSPHNLEASIWLRGGSDKKSRGFLQEHTKAGRRHSKHASGQLAVPTKHVPRTGAGRIAKTHRPKRLLAKIEAAAKKAAGRSTRRRVGLKRPSYFLRDGKIFKREGQQIKLWYSLKKSVRTKNRFRWYETLNRKLDAILAQELLREVQQTFEYEARRGLKKAMAVL